MQPALSSNENYLAFIRRQGENNANLYVIKFDLGAILSNTNQYKNVYNNTLDLVKNGIEAQPVWSPYGPNLAFLNLSNNSFDIAVTGIKTTEMGKISTGSIVNITKQSNIDSTSKIYWEK
jgi:Tol biopolymer transport system component